MLHPWTSPVVSQGATSEPLCPDGTASSETWANWLRIKAVINVSYTTDLFINVHRAISELNLVAPFHSDFPSCTSLYASESVQNLWMKSVFDKCVIQPVSRSIDTLSLLSVWCLLTQMPSLLFTFFFYLAWRNFGTNWENFKNSVITVTIAWTLDTTLTGSNTHFKNTLSKLEKSKEIPNTVYTRD